MKKELRQLAQPLQKWVESEGWKNFRLIQTAAITAILSDESHDRDFVLSATTASGKTEAAFLPLLTDIYRKNQEPRPSYEILYLSPLKALINDMTDRVKRMARCVGRSAYRRHGDVTGKERADEQRGSRGVLLTTPESLEAQFIRSGENLKFVFADLQAIVVDEVHAYFESPRGPQLISLLTRLESVLAEECGTPNHRIRRVGLSATVSGGGGPDTEAVQAFLRPSDPDKVVVLCPEEAKNPIKVYLRVFVDKRETDTDSKKQVQPPVAYGEPAGLQTPAPVVMRITRDLFEKFRNCEKGLIFTNSRREAEQYAELLNCEARAAKLVANPDFTDGIDEKTNPKQYWERQYSPKTRRFWPHHGSLDNWIRSAAEHIMRDKTEPSILVCTSTLELGIDIGTVEATAQIGPGYSVASLRQRLGRSGRREGKIPTLYAYVREPEFAKDIHPVERLHPQTFRTLAQIHLLEKGIFEPPDPGRLNLSTLTQQLLSYVHQQHNEEGVDPELAHQLFVANGPFRSANEVLDPLIERLAMKFNPFLEDQNGRLFLTPAGTKYVEHFTFYAAFNTPEEFTVRAGARKIGMFAPRYPYGPGDQFLLGGAFWEVTRVDHMRRIMEVIRTSGGHVPYFEGEALAPSHPVIQTMFELYCSRQEPELPKDTNDAGRQVIADGRKAYRDLFRQHGRVIEHGDSTVLFPWVGTRKQITLVCALKWLDLPAAAMDVAVIVRNRSRQEVLDKLKHFLKHPKPTAHDLARYGSKLTFEKHDNLLSPALKRVNFASAKLDMSSLDRTIEQLLQDEN